MMVVSGHHQEALMDMTANPVPPLMDPSQQGYPAPPQPAPPGAYPGVYPTPTQPQQPPLPAYQVRGSIVDFISI